MKLSAQKSATLPYEFVSMMAQLNVISVLLLLLLYLDLYSNKLVDNYIDVLYIVQ